MKFILCDPLRSWLYNRPLDTASPPIGPEPSSSCGKGNPLPPTKRPAQTSVSFNSRILSVSTQSTVFTSPSGSTTRRLIHKTLLSPQPVPVLLGNWRRNMSMKVGIETSRLSVSISQSTTASRSISGTNPNTCSHLRTVRTNI